MEVKRLAPRQGFAQGSALPTCQHDVDINSEYTQNFRQDVFKKKARRYAHTERPNQCTFPAKVEVDGKPYCRRHGGQLALDFLIDQTAKGAASDQPDDCE